MLKKPKKGDIAVLLAVLATVIAIVMAVGSADLAHTNSVNHVNTLQTVNVTGRNSTLTGPEIPVPGNQTDSYNETTIALFYSYNNSIVPGQTIWHQSQIVGNPASLNIDVGWQDPQDDLELFIYTADGQMLGPYNDSADGRRDSQIYLDVINPNGVVDGTWYFKLTDKGNVSNEEYFIRTW